MLTNTPMQSYDQNGKKLSFANWISNLSPQECPFTSMTGKESINQTLFQWQTDSLSPVDEDNAQLEGAEAKAEALKNTAVLSNVTQILNKVVKVSDTANATANYGRGRELQYQMEKKGKELKRDLEWALLNNHIGGTSDAGTNGTLEHVSHGTAGAALNEFDASALTGGYKATNGPGIAAGAARRTDGFRGLVGNGADGKTPDLDTGAVAVLETDGADTIAIDGADYKALTEEKLFEMTYNLYLSGSEANIIMFHPMHAKFFSGLQEISTGSRARIFENTPKFSVYVSTVVDPLGREYKLIPNRWMPKTAIYAFNPKDWTQMVLRAPQRTKLAKDGSYEKWMIEMEVGLRHRNPYASAYINFVK